MAEIISNTAQVKKNNIKLIREAFLELKQASKIMIAKKTGLSVATCNTLLNELSKTGEIVAISDEKKPSGAGRPSKTYRLNCLFSLLCCIRCFHKDSLDFMICEVFDILGNLIFEKETKEKQLSYSHIQSAFASILKEHSDIRALSMGIQGFLDSDGTIINCSLPSLNGLCIAEAIEKDFNVPVILDTELNLITYGFYHQSTENSFQNIVSLEFNQGKCTQSSILFHGQLIRGKDNTAGNVSILNSIFEIGSRGLFRNSSKSTTEQSIAKIICIFIQLLNPDIIILTGNDVKLSFLGTLNSLCAHYVSDEQMPSFTYIQSPKEFYQRGLFKTAQKLQDGLSIH